MLSFQGVQKSNDTLDLTPELAKMNGILSPTLKQSGSSWLEPRVCTQVFVEKGVAKSPKSHLAQLM